MGNFFHLNPSDDQMKKILSKSEKFEFFALCQYIYVPVGINGLTETLKIVFQQPSTGTDARIFRWGGQVKIEGILCSQLPISRAL